MKQTRLDMLRDDLEKLKDPALGEELVIKELQKHELSAGYLDRWMNFSKFSENVYPSQGLLTTPHDYLHYDHFHLLPIEDVIETLRRRWFFLKLFNHPYRIHYLDQVNKMPFEAPRKIDSPVFEHAQNVGLALSIGDLGAIVTGSMGPRMSRKERYSQGPFVKLGRQARTLFVGSSSPDVWNSAAAIATMAASHCLTNIPRNGVTSKMERQADLATEVFEWLDDMAEKLLVGRSDKEKVLGYWKNNVMGTLGANPEKDLVRARLLYERGVRVFRVYSPEPGTGVIDTLKVIRKHFKNKVEIFAGQIVDVEQAIEAEKSGADGLYLGIGGGGRCITGVRSGSVIDWPELTWNLRGKINIPVIVEGGASDHIATSLLLGVSGIGVSRVVSGGTVESPGGALYCADQNGKLYKPYGGEASARTKYLDGKLLPFQIPSFVEGETTKAEKSYVKYVYPTLTYNLHIMNEDAILALVFRNVSTISELQNLDPSPIRQNTSFGSLQQHTH